MYENELKEVNEELKDYGDKLNNKAFDFQIENLIKKVKDKYNYELPKEYCDFLRECNGFEFNGYIIYGTDDFIDNNEDYELIRENKYILIGDYNIGFLAVKIEDNCCYELDKPSGEEMQKFDSVKDMIKYFLNESIK